jgi:hypothetical protein
MAIKKYSKVKFTLRKELIFILAAVVVMVVATILLNLPNKEEKFLKDWNAAGSTLTENLVYEEVSFDELEDVIKNENAFVLFASPEDTASVAIFDQVYSLALNVYEIEKVYLVDSAFVVGKDREEDSDFDAELKAIEAKFADSEGNTITLDQTPNLWYFEGGKLVAEADQELVESEANDWNAALNQILILSAK